MIEKYAQKISVYAKVVAIGATITHTAGVIEWPDSAVACTVRDWKKIASKKFN